MTLCAPTRSRHRAFTLVSMLAPAAVAVVAVAVALRRICDCAAYVLLRASWTAVPSAPAPAAANRPARIASAMTSGSSLSTVRTSGLRPHAARTHQLVIGTTPRRSE